jgi:uncharacterized membrane protein YccF (DUF307 family)
MLRFIGNILWLIIAGWSMCIAYLVAGLLLAITIIGIPFAIASWRLAFFVIWPFGRTAVHDPNRVPGVSAIANILWFILAGWWLALGHILGGIILCVTIIGIPFGIQSFKLAALAMAPLAREIVSNDDPRVFVQQ